MNRQIIGRVFCATVFLVSLVARAQAPDYSPIWLKNDTRTFNHIYEYAIENNAIWYRSHVILNDPWKRIDFDADASVNPVSIRADGANLMVLDSRREIHYKKVIKEQRSRQGDYHFEDLNNEPNWMSNWFSLPIVNWPRLLLNPKRLRLPEDVTLWSISHRGKFNAYFEDLNDKKHAEFSMVTTVYIVSPDGEEVIYADPFVLMGFNRKKSRVPAPWLPDPLDPKVLRRLKIDQIDSSASTVLIAGWHFGKRRLFYQPIDYDLKRRNPFLPGFYNPVCTVAQEWIEIPLPLHLAIQNNIHPRISIHQTGMGNTAREIRFEGYDEDGHYGFYVKSSLDAPWRFKLVQSPLL